MIAWVPLSARYEDSSPFDEFVEGIPRYLRDPVRRWMTATFMMLSRKEAVVFLERMSMRLRLEKPFSVAALNPGFTAVDRIMGDPEFTLDSIDYLLAHIPEIVRSTERAQRHVDSLEAMLMDSSSAWTAVESGSSPVRYALARRAPAVIDEAIENSTSRMNPQRHLEGCWLHLSHRNADPSRAYSEAVKAVEAAAKPIVTPMDPRPTLGKMIAALRDAPSKWVYEAATHELILSLMQSLWVGQLDRHGTDDESAQTSVSLRQARFAFHNALLLVSLFSSGAIRREAR